VRWAWSANPAAAATSATAAPPARARRAARSRSCRFELPEGTVYPALHRLEEAGLLASAWDVASGRRRRIYRLTPGGAAALAEQAEQWRAFSGSVARVLGTPAAGMTWRPLLRGALA
jgi:Transcriptional regulator PadR-like family